MMIRPHDLIWIDHKTTLFCDNAWPEWVSKQWQTHLPLVIRRDHQQQQYLPIGVRGSKRSERFAAYVNRADIVKCISPEALLNELDDYIARQSIVFPTIQALGQLKQFGLPWRWGVTGSCGYALATDEPVISDESDLDLLIRCPDKPNNSVLIDLKALLVMLPCRVDVQIETSYGGFALNEWLRDEHVMLKTNTGPILTKNPWKL